MLGSHIILQLPYISAEKHTILCKFSSCINGKGTYRPAQLGDCSDSVLPEAARVGNSRHLEVQGYIYK